jgi:hypothetical protein
MHAYARKRVVIWPAHPGDRTVADRQLHERVRAHAEAVFATHKCGMSFATLFCDEIAALEHRDRWLTYTLSKIDEFSRIAVDAHEIGHDTDGLVVDQVRGIRARIDRCWKALSEDGGDIVTLSDSDDWATKAFERTWKQNAGGDDE